MSNKRANESPAADAEKKKAKIAKDLRDLANEASALAASLLSPDTEEAKDDEEEDPKENLAESFEVQGQFLVSCEFIRKKEGDPDGFRMMFDAKNFEHDGFSGVNIKVENVPSKMML